MLLQAADADVGVATKSGAHVASSKYRIITKWLPGEVILPGDHQTRVGWYDVGGRETVLTEQLQRSRACRVHVAQIGPGNTWAARVPQEATCVQSVWSGWPCRRPGRWPCPRVERGRPRGTRTLHQPRPCRRGSGWSSARKSKGSVRERSALIATGHRWSDPSGWPHERSTAMPANTTQTSMRIVTSIRGARTVRLSFAGAAGRSSHARPGRVRRPSP